jgi:glutathione S-transferase
LALGKFKPLDRAAIASEGLASMQRSAPALVGPLAPDQGVAMIIYTALVTLASVFFYGWLGFCVGRARVKYKIAAPATTGDPDFERIYRVQMNTLEWLPIYLPCLWLFGYYVSDGGAALLGLVWILGRYIYKRGYEEAPEKRSLGFVVQALASTVLLLGALIDILARLAFGD